eukprot:TRINITY_DN4382_c0_g1_i2.p1 TRINITY_DN4382_c0_g1~~TRINITY_DN4382_c0_g1_i2.p1  ORF type:complete len:277 (-),score=71.23 TRINITY_DN4382_c0_g1_i2:258-1028(-)
MVKIKTISRSEEEFTRGRSSELFRVFHNVNPDIHPFEKGREYVRALNATKIDKIFAKPFIGALSGHMDGVFSMSKHPTSLSYFFSGGCDGELRAWHLPTRTTIGTQLAHRGFVRGISVSSDGERVVSAGDDKTVKLWSFNPDEEDQDEIFTLLNTYNGSLAFTAIDFQRQKHVFATTSASQLEIWNEERTDPINTFNWGVDSLLTVKFNPIETHLVVATAADRSISLFDIRESTPLKKFILAMKTNAVFMESNGGL